MNNYLTYKVSNTTSQKKIAAESSVSSFNRRENKDAVSKRKDFLRRLLSKEDSDCGYQSEDAYKSFANKFQSRKSSDLSYKTSTKKDLPDLQTDEYPEHDEVFTHSRKVHVDNKNETNTCFSTHCQHSQCQQCMIDMLWKNRIREQVRLPLYRETSEVIQKLQTVFGEDLFRTVYNTLISQWEGNDSDCIPSVIKNVTDSLNFSQLQHLPLMMQLIQLDLITK